MKKNVKEIEDRSRERIIYIIDTFCNGSRVEFSKRTGIGKSSISQYVNGTNAPGSLTASKIGDAFRIDPMWVMGFDVPMRQPEVIDYEKLGFRRIEQRILPVIGNIACGSPSLAVEERRYITLADVPSQATHIFVAQGDSMINARIKDGDYVFITAQPEVENGEIAAVMVGEEATLKRFYRQGDTITLVAENPSYAPLVYSGADCEQIKVLGKAIAFQSTLG